MILPFFDHAIQFAPDSELSPRFRTLMVFGTSAPAGLAILHTRKSPSALCTANISDLCLEEEACQARPTMGDGAREVDRVCKMVKFGSSVAISSDPFWYLILLSESLAPCGMQSSRTRSHMSSNLPPGQWRLSDRKSSLQTCAPK